MKVQPMLWRMTSPSLRTNLLVETPTLAVWGAIGLPISAPTEFRVGSSSGGMPSCAPTSAWNLPNMALVEVFEPRSEEHTSELQSLRHLVCRLLLEKKKNKKSIRNEFIYARFNESITDVLHVH